MDVKIACLGLLTFGEASGYDLKKHFESSLAHFFAVGFGSIYPALAALADEGLVACTEVAQNGKPDRKVYRITDAGREHLGATLATADLGHKLRSEFLAAIYFAHLMSGDRLNAILDHRVADLDRMLGQIDDCRSTERLPAGVNFVRGFGEAVIRAAKDYIQLHRDELVQAVTAEQSPSNRPRVDRRTDWLPV
jgi:DNA-binding PadR family transcriptional regulator